MELKGKKVVILAEDLYNELELWYPYYRLKEAGADVLIMGSGAADTFHSKLGMPVKADTDAVKISEAEFDAVVIPGGYAPDRMRRYPAMVRLIREMNEDGKVVAAICHAGWMLASAGILEGRKVTSYTAIRDDLVHAGAEWIDSEVVVDGNLITSQQPEDLPAFSRAIIEKMKDGNGG